jgi:hypothetical protein
MEKHINQIDHVLIDKNDIQIQMCDLVEKLTDTIIWWLQKLDWQ